jgi:hypothetical protein
MKIKLYFEDVALSYKQKPTLFWIITFVFIGFYNTLFLNQAISGYNSDINGHLNFILNPDSINSYSFMHELTRGIMKFFTLFNPKLGEKLPEISLGILVFVLSVSMFASILLVRTLLSIFYPQEAPLKRDIFSILLFLISMIVFDFRVYVPHYLGNWSPNPIHNPTYIFARPFAILLFFTVCSLISKLLKQAPTNEYLIYVPLLSILTMWAKPSFMLSFLPAVLLYLFILILKKKITFRRAFKNSLLLLVGLIPLYFINSKIYNSSLTDDKVVISYAESWYHHSKSIGISIILAGAFPIYIYVLSLYKQLKNKNQIFQHRHVLAGLNYVFGIFVYLFLFEEGSRSYHANFSWTYMFSLFFLFFSSVDLFWFSKQYKLSNILSVIGVTLFLLHLVSGIYYFALVFFGYNFA